MFENKKAFTLIEIMLGILIVSIVLVSGFDAFAKVSYGKISLIEKANMQKNSFYFSEKLFQLIKEGGTIDYEEYFNRKVVGNTTFSNGHYDLDTGYGNFGNSGILGGTSNYGDEFYYCNSQDGVFMGTGGCVEDNNINQNSTSSAVYDDDYDGEYQRYLQYSLQFIDFNSNYDSDLGDEDGNGFIIGDDDDEYLGEGPVAFNKGENLTELYLISGNGEKRTLLRWNIITDPDKISSVSCVVSGGTTPSGDGCRGTIEFLQLEGRDWGLDHDDAVNDSDGTQYDGVIDTWVIDSVFTGLTNDTESSSIIAGSNSTDYREELFPDSVNVSDFKVYLYPNINYEHSWKSFDIDSVVSPYAMISFKIKPSWKTRAVLQGDSEELSFSTTVNLTDIYSN